MEDQQISHLLQNTDIISIVLTILGCNNNVDTLIGYLKLESGWILTNIAYGDSESLQMLFNPNMNLNFISIIGSILNQYPRNLALIDQIMFLMGNLSSGGKQLRKEIRHNFDLIRVIEDIVQTEKSIPKQFAANFIWIASMLSKDAEVLQQLEIQRLVNIFDIFINGFVQ